jgi:hypothetical protein
MCANSAATRPRLSHTPARIFSISSGRFSGKAGAQVLAPDLVLGKPRPDEPHQRAERLGHALAIDSMQHRKRADHEEAEHSDRTRA